jgi:sugar-phosphatase
LKPQAIIFDLDGLLIDSEPFWYTAEKIHFKTVGLELSDADCILTTGMRIDKVARYWHARQPWPAPPTPDEVAAQINDRVIEFIRARGELLPGASQAVQFAAAQVDKVGLASSSGFSLIWAALDTFDLRRYFQTVASADTSGFSKPHPAVYLEAAQALGVDPAACLAVEDSINGLVAAKAASMKCLVVPGHGLRTDPRFALADYRLDTLEGFNTDFWQQL